MYKKVYYSEIVFTDKFFVNGIDVLDEENLTFIKYVDVDLKISLSFSKLDNAKLYEIKKLKEKIAIAKVRDFNIICYLTSGSVRKLFSPSIHKEDCVLNEKLLEKLAIGSISKEVDEDIIYSKDYRSRALIRDKDGLVSLSYPVFDIYDEGFLYFTEDISSTNFWQWENLGGVSYFSSKEDAKKEAILFFDNNTTTDLEEPLYQTEK